MEGSKSRVCLVYPTSHVGMLQHAPPMGEASTASPCCQTYGPLVCIASQDKILVTFPIVIISILNHFRDFWRWGISWPWNIGYRSLTLRSYARSVHRWNLQTRGYYFRRQYEFIFIRFIRSKLQKKLVVQCHSRSSQIEIGANRKSMCDFLLAFHCDWLSSNET